MHGRLIVFYPKRVLCVKRYMDTIRDSLRLDYIGDEFPKSSKADSDEETDENLFELFKEALRDTDSKSVSVYEMFHNELEFPVAIVNGDVRCFRSYIEFKAYCDYYDFGYIVESYRHKFYDFHF